MKVIIIVLMMCLSTGVSHSQTPGDLLIKSQKSFTLGTSFLFAGTGAIIGASFINPYDYNNNISAAGNQLKENEHKFKKVNLFILGGTMSCIGLGYIINSHIQIYKAGLLLNSNGIGVSIKF